MPKTITVRELLRDIDAATATMSRSNHHRWLLIRCGAAILELAQRSHGVEPVYLGTPEPEEVAVAPV